MPFYLQSSRNAIVMQENTLPNLFLTAPTGKPVGAVRTKGYAFAYQAFGKYMWDSKSKEITPMVLAKADDALAQKVYDKIWSELPPKDKWYLSFIVQKDSMDASELLEITKKKHSDWSEQRRRLIEKGVIDGQVRGKIILKLPRFKEYVESKQF